MDGERMTTNPLAHILATLPDLTGDELLQVANVAIKLRDRQTVRPVPFALVVNVACDHLRVTPADVCGSNSGARYAPVVAARTVIAEVGHKYCLISFPEMADAMQLPNHSSVATARMRFERTRDDPITLYGRETTLRAIADAVLRECVHVVEERV